MRTQVSSPLCWSTLISTNQSMSSWWLQMSWCLIGTKPSATIMVTGDDAGTWKGLHNTYHVTATTLCGLLKLLFKCKTGITCKIEVGVGWWVLFKMLANLSLDPCNIRHWFVHLFEYSFVAKCKFVNVTLGNSELTSISPPPRSKHSQDRLGQTNLTSGCLAQGQNRAYSNPKR